MSTRDDAYYGAEVGLEMSSVPESGWQEKQCNSPLHRMWDRFKEMRGGETRECSVKNSFGVGVAVGIGRGSKRLRAPVMRQGGDETIAQREADSRWEGVVVSVSYVSEMESCRVCVVQERTNVVFYGAFGGVEMRRFVVGEGVDSMREAIGGIHEIIAVPRWDSGQLHRNSEGHIRRIHDL
ncbi:hypothetical protein Tco_1218796 [Tanacetum coccineum]